MLRSLFPPSKRRYQPHTLFIAVLAKTSPHVLSPELFALELGLHFVNKYVHIHKAFITIEKLRWSRIPGKENAGGHPHSFMRDGEDKEIVEVEASFNLCFPRSLVFRLV